MNACAQHIHMAYADLEVSAPIVQSLVDEVEGMRRGKEVRFEWDTNIFTPTLNAELPPLCNK